MSLTEDSPPFTVLQQSAEHFKSAFEADINKCLMTLNSKIGALMCDPDSLVSSSGNSKRGNAHVEFSMAKYGILASMKALFEEVEKDWLDQLSEMREEFIENVEVFLANTKLEVKLPALGVSPHVGIGKSPAGSKVVKQDKSPSAVSSIYPKLYNTAKHIPVLSSLLPKDEDEEGDSSEEGDYPIFMPRTSPVPVAPIKPSGRTPKRVTINTSEQYIPSPGRNGLSRKRGNQPAAEASKLLTKDVVESESEEEEEEPVVVQTPVQRYGRGRKSTVNTPASVKRESAFNVLTNNDIESENEEPVVIQTPVKRGGRGRKSTVNTPVSVKKETVNTPLRGRNASRIEMESESSISSGSNEEKAAPLIETKRRGRKSGKATPAMEAVLNSTPGKKARTPRKNTNNIKAQQQPVVPEDVMETSEDETPKITVDSKTPKQVQFALGLDPNEDLDIYSPEVNIAKSYPRRKTMVSHAMDNFSDICLTPEVVRGKSKRKTFGGNLLDQSVAPSPKRLKRAGGRSSLAPSTSAMEYDMDTNLLDSEGSAETGKYSPWIPLADIGGKVPAQPGIYELKVAQAKKPAYIGACDSLRQKLTLHKLVHNSGHKHLDKFIERNANNVLVRYEQVPSITDAKVEEKNRLKNFVSCYKTTPAYN